MAENTLQRTVYLGTFVHSKSLEVLEIRQRTAIFVDENGKILAVEKDVADSEAARGFFSRLGWSEEEGKTSIHECHGEEFFFPGFIGIVLRLHKLEPHDTKSRQIRTSTPRSMPMRASSARPLSWTG